MTVLNEQEISWINQVAGRLRLIQGDAASASPEKRRDFLQEEVARSFKDVPAANQKRYLEALLARFPVRGQVALSSTPAAVAAPPPPPPPAPEPETPEQTIDRFFALVSSLPPEKRAEVAQRLYEAGLAQVDQSALVFETSNELRQRLGLAENQQPNLTRVVELVVLLIDVFGRLDQTALTTMREISPKSRLLRRPEDFRTATARFLTGGEPVDAHLRGVSSLLGGMLTAILTAGKDFGRQYVEQLSPNAIEDVVMCESAKLFGPNKKERCWDKYRDLADAFATPDLVDRRIKDCMAAIVEKPVR